jgi:hypothetical protein
VQPCMWPKEERSKVQGFRISIKIIIIKEEKAT